MLIRVCFRIRSFPQRGILTKKHPTSSELIGSFVLPVLVYMPLDHLLSQGTFLPPDLIFEAFCPCSPARCPLSGSVIYDRFLCLYLLSQSFEGSLWLVLSSEGLMPILWSLFLCCWLHMSESRFLERIGHLLQGKSTFLKSTNG